MRLPVACRDCGHIGVTIVIPCRHDNDFLLEYVETETERARVKIEVALNVLDVSSLILGPVRLRHW